MTRMLVTLASAMCLITGIAFAGPTVMTDEQLDSQVAGLNYETKSGNVVWSMSLFTKEYVNNGDHGNWEKASRGIMRAREAGGLVTEKIKK